MSMLHIPMYRDNGARIQLIEFLAELPENDWIWSILEFDGVGQMPANESVLEFQSRVCKQPRGLVLTWSEMSKFAEAVEYTIDCLIVAVPRIESLDSTRLLADDFQGCEVAIRAVDSTEWVLFSSSRELLDKMKRVAH